jgi:Concanavalin A-like lectin/glucanases superfamily/Secretion system C-terminal sorting domain
MKKVTINFVYALSVAILFVLAAQKAHAQYQNSLAFDATSTFVEVPAASAVIAGPNTKLSMSLWVYPTHVPAGFPDFDGFAGMRNDLDADFYLIALSATNVEARFRNSTGTFFTLNYNGLQMNTWQHFVLTYDNAKLRLYKNGVRVDSIAATGNITNTTVPMFIGDVKYQFTNFFLGGKIDEFGLWNKALNLAEIKCIYKSPIDISSPGLQLYYDFNQGIAGSSNLNVTTLQPKFGNILGTLNAFALTGTISNWVDGVVNYTPLNVSLCAGQSYFFNGQTLTTTGSYSKVLAAANGCDSVTVLTLKIPDTSIVFSGNKLQVDFVPGATYQWRNCTTNTAIAGATSNSYTPTANGSYKVVVTLPASPTCIDSSACFNLINLTASALANDNTSIVYPNPFENECTIRFSKEQKQVELILLDLTGKEIERKVYENVKTIQASYETLSPGVYFLHLKAATETKMIKVIKK